MTFATIANAASAFSSSFFYESITDSGASAIWVQGAGYLVTIYFAQLSRQYKLTGNFIGTYAFLSLDFTLALSSLL